MNKEIKQETNKGNNKASVIIAVFVVVLAVFVIFKPNQNTKNTETAKTVMEQTRDVHDEKAIARIDIQTKLVDAAKSQFDIYVDDSKTPEEQANWMPKYGSQGYVVQKEGYSMVLNIKSYLNGKIRLTLRGKERRPNGVDPVPVWVTYTSLKINDKEVLTSPETVWLSEGYEYNIEAKAGEEYKIHVEWQKPDKIPEK